MTSRSSSGTEDPTWRPAAPSAASAGTRSWTAAPAPSEESVLLVVAEHPASRRLPRRAIATTDGRRGEVRMRRP